MSTTRTTRSRRTGTGGWSRSGCSRVLRGHWATPVVEIVQRTSLPTPGDAIVEELAVFCFMTAVSAPCPSPGAGSAVPVGASERSTGADRRVLVRRLPGPVIATAGTAAGAYLRPRGDPPHRPRAFFEHKALRDARGWSNENVEQSRRSAKPQCS